MSPSAETRRLIADALKAMQAAAARGDLEAVLRARDELRHLLRMLRG